MQSLEHQVNRSKKLSRAISVAILTGIIIIGALFLITSYRNQLSDAKIAELKRLTSITQSTAAAINGDSLTSFLAQFPEKDDITSNSQDPYYAGISGLLRDIQQSNKLETPIYILLKDKENIQMGITSTAPFYRHPYLSAPPELNSKFEQGGSLGPYTDEHGAWLSGFTPITDSKGRTVGVVQADEKFDSFISKARNTLFSRLIFFTVLLIVVGLLMLFISQRYVDSMKRITESLQTMVEEKTVDLNLANTKLQRINDHLEEEVRHRTEDLDIMNRDLSIKNEELRFYSTAISHDLKEPLRMVNRFSQLITQKYADLLPKEGLPYFTYISEGSYRAMNMLTSLSSYSQVDVKSSKFDKVYLRNAVKEAVQNLKLKLEETNASVQVNLDKEVVLGHHESIVQLFQNLIINAIKYSEGHPQIEIGVMDDGSHSLIIYCRDNGIGLAENEWGKIFDLFHRVENEGVEGSGIGLAIVKKIVDAHSGIIWVESELGKGTTFLFTLGN